MNSKLQQLLNLIQQSEKLSADDKATLSGSIKEVNKEIEITSFKLERTEKVKHTTAILLEETIEELEQKRKAVEAQNKELEIEASLERVRTVAMSMNKADDMLDVCKTISNQLELLNVKEIRNVQTAIFYEEKGTYMNYEYYAKHNKTFITETSYTNNELHKTFAAQMMKGAGEFFIRHINGDDVKDWIIYQKTTNVFIDDFLYTASSLSYYWFSLGPVALGISTYNPLTEDEINLFKRFLKVFELAYRRYLDIEKAEAQAREAQIQLALERARAQSMMMQHSTELDDTLRVFHEQVLQLNIPSAFSFLWLPEEDKDRHIFWAAWAENLPAGQAGNSIVFKSKAINYPLDRNEPATAQCLIDWKSNQPVVSYHVPPDGVENYFAAWSELIAGVEQLKPEYFSDGLYYVEAFMKYGCFGVMTSIDLTQDEKNILDRFATEFERAYTRFLDLQKAEAQARESQIQLALERVRARTMAMQKSDELSETASEMFRQIQLLGLKAWSCGFNIIDKEKKQITQWVSTGDGRILPAFVTPSDEDVFQRFTLAAEKDKSFYVEEMSGEVLKAHYQYMASLPEVKKILDEFQSLEITPPNFQVFHLASFSYGYLLFITHKPAPEFYDVFKRFATVFDQTYRRFLDLQKAEAQARESQIEVALERVRSRSMGMQKSEELKEVIQIVYQQLTHLNIYLDHAGFVVDYIPKGDWHFWIADEQDIPAEITHPYFESVWATQFNEAKEKATNFFVTHLNFEEKNKFYNELLSYVPGLPEASKDFYLSRPGLAATTVLFDNVSLYIENFEGIPYSDEDNKTLMRFGKVFQQTYTRFNDLKQAEAQARESKIEAALESVRSASLAMHHSNQLKTVAAVMFKKLMELGLTLSGAFIFLFDKKTRDIQLWIATTTLSEPGEINIPFTPAISKNSIFKDLWSVIENGEQIFNQVYSGKEKDEYFRHVANHNSFPQEIKDFHQQAKSWITSIVGEKHAAIGFDSWDEQLATMEDFQILKKFSKVFEQAYTRFLDLQKAEAQTRESQIELSLERVRAKTMAMHNSADVGATAAVMVDELKKLDIETIRCGIGIMHEPGDMEVWTISTDENNKTDIIIGWLDMNMHPLLHGAFESWRRKNESYSYELKDDDLLNYYNAINKYPGYPIRYDTTSLPKLIHHNEFTFTEGILFAFSLQQLTDEQRKIFKRFAGVFGQTYRRYLDLKRAEAQAKEAQIEAALERVRSRTLAMQKSDELAETSAVLFKQLISLGIKPNRLYISIMKDDVGNSEFWITDEDGSKVSKAYEDNLNNNLSFKKMYEGWKQQKKSLVIDMKGKALKEYLNHLTSIHVPFKGGLTQKRRLQYIAYFSKGFIGMASPDEQPAETLQLLERFAYVFNLTFTRFNDLQIAEAHAVQAEHDLIEIKAARTKAEETLAELQSTQKQLVQSEKMASLGELTAGIAHEIQNPLNFVNNFSEVSKELIDEMKAALEHGDKEEADAIANDIIQNLEKINHHGKRADAIVKGMLQHSRKSEGKKEPTDINALCDEYLRLSYHGLRAKDKEFNADFKTDFDESIGKINIVPQDIGRVLLNLINNAFYAVNEKKKTADEIYQPTVIVQTKKINDKVEIKVSDNGNGIPQNIIDKIFQPFFTTKPTGQGTGLGLSLAYDIITKEHNGTIKVESKEGEGTTFIINLPV